MSLPDGPYDSRLHEPEILKFWFENNAYSADVNSNANNWTLICPPPNAYARPHIGNISGYGFQDAMARYYRMKGYNVLVIPGKDHAGLEGEAVFVREVLEKSGRKKFDMSREDFYQEMMEFFRSNMAVAQNDEKKIGLSADFSKDTFTLDPEVVDIVLETFIEMYKKGMIYKGIRIVNWDPKARTAVADNQVIYEESQTPFFYFKYVLTNPIEKALEIKNKLSNKIIKFIKSDQTNYKTVNNYQFDIRISAKFQLTQVDLDCIPIGYDTDDLLQENKLEGKVIGIEMRLDNKFRLLVSKTNQDINEKQVFETWKLISSYHKNTDYEPPAGCHFLLFEKHNKDLFYTNGFVIGTVRPETIFADTAIACNPSDARYSEYVGKKVKVEFLGKKKTLSFISDYAVDQYFGTGLLKITPAHSNEDWEIAQRNRDTCLPPIQVISYDLKLNKLTGENYTGLSIQEARNKLKIDMFNNGNLVYIDEEYKNKIKISERTKAPIEPLLSSQWYLSYDIPIEEGGKTLRQAAIDMVKNRELQIHPENMVSKFMHWMENLRDWAISRSLWWGYRLPVWYNGKLIEKINDDGTVKEYLLQKNNDGTYTEVPLEYNNTDHIRVQKESPGKNWVQDEAVLDTWFSSGQWVYAVLKKHNLLDQRLPTDVLVSAHDILENWDSRMMMFTYFKHKTIPFKHLYLTGLVLGKDGQKMSKSKGNVLDMDEIVNKYGTDAVRLSFFYQNTAGANYAITEDKLKNFKQFINKIWNASKYVIRSSKINLEQEYKLCTPKLEFSIKMLNHIAEVTSNVEKNIESFEFGRATDTLYHEFWHTFCDILIEESKKYLLPLIDKASKKVISEPDKTEKNEVSNVMIYVLKQYMKLLHPFIPFVTQKIWFELPLGKDDNIVLMKSKL